MAPGPANLIYHIASAADWDRALAEGEYRRSTRGMSLADVGFIHASTAWQVTAVANALYSGETDLLILVIDADLVRPEVRYEQVPDSDEPFPHIYGPLSVGAVVRTVPLAPDAAGQFSFPADDG